VIIKGNQRGGARALAAHISNTRDNDHVELHELRGFASTDLLGALLEIETAAAGTRCTQPFFSVSINPPPGYPATLAQHEMAADAIEAKNPGLAGQPRAFLSHEKNGRGHSHFIWSRIDAATGKAIPLRHSRLKLRDVSRAMYAAMGLEAPAGIKDRTKADPLNYDQQTWQQAKRLGEDPRDLKQIIQQAWAVSDNRASFESALERHAMHLARGDRRGFVVVHHSGEPMSLTRYANLKTKDVEARIGKPEQLQTIDQVQSVLHASITAAAEKRLSDMKEKHRRELRPFAARAAQMRLTHQTERDALHARQAKRQQREDLARANRLRNGLIGLWDRLSGKRGKVSELNAREAATNQTRDRDECQAVIDRQITERGQLQANVGHVHDRHQHERTYQRAELAVMMSMMKHSTREQFQEHAQEIDDGYKDQQPAPDAPDQGEEQQPPTGKVLPFRPNPDQDEPSP
jgi:Relaxase/Mobilisation nuclease domain